MSLTMNYASHSDDFLAALLIDLCGRYAYNAPNLTGREHDAYRDAIYACLAELKSREPQQSSEGK